jgi:hypothetical protein
VQRGGVGQRPAQHGVGAAGPGLQDGEGGAYGLAQVAADPDAVPLWSRLVGLAGHLLSAQRRGPPAGGCTVARTCMLIPPDLADLTASSALQR